DAFAKHALCCPMSHHMPPITIAMSSTRQMPMQTPAKIWARVSRQRRREAWVRGSTDKVGLHALAVEGRASGERVAQCALHWRPRIGGDFAQQPLAVRLGVAPHDRGVLGFADRIPLPTERVAMLPIF